MCQVRLLYLRIWFGTDLHTYMENFCPSVCVVEFTCLYALLLLFADFKLNRKVVKPHFNDYVASYIFTKSEETVIMVIVFGLIL